jgi:sulfur-oxidizing protein SoxZ
MAKPVKIKAKVKNGVAQVKALMPHIMETGTRKDAESGETIPAHYIEEVLCEHNGTVVMTAYWGTGVSKNPYMSFKIKDAKVGDKIKVSWTDNKGEKSEGETEAK